MITTAGVGVGGAGMLRARRRDVSVKPNRKLDRKSSRGMIYENEELRLRTININAEVEQGQNDIKKLRRENEQLRREIWCLREEYDKLEEILKSQKSRNDSESDEDLSDDESSSTGSNSSANSSETSEKVEKLLSDTKPEKIQAELLENAENQKLSSEKKMNSINRLQVDFDQLSMVEEEEESRRNSKDTRIKNSETELMKNHGANDVDVKRDLNHLTKQAFNWMDSGDCPVLPIDQSVQCSGSLIKNEGCEMREIGWENKILEKSSSLTIPERLLPSSSSENTASTIVQKTSPDICVSGAVASQFCRNSRSSDNLLLNARENLLKSLSHSCQELKTESFGLRAKMDNLLPSPKAFKSQIKVQLSRGNGIANGNEYNGTISDCFQYHGKHHEHHENIEATSFEHPNPQTLTLPPLTFQSLIRTSRSEKRIFPWPEANPQPPRVDNETQTQSPSPSASQTSGEPEKDANNKEIKTLNSKKKKKRKSERRSSSVETQKKQKNIRTSQLSRGGRASTRSPSMTCTEIDGNIKEVMTLSEGKAADKLRKNSVNSESLPWCACWGNGCV